MAHLSYVREALVINSSSLRVTRPLNMEPSNFAAFCGDPQQRRAVGLQSIAGFCGRVGIVVIHDDDYIEAQLSSLPRTLNLPSLTVQSSRGKVYDPLYGMTANAIADLLAPKTAGVANPNAIDRLRSGIFAYLQIMDYQFSVNPTPFGRYPYNLDLLLQMTAMPYNLLYSQIIQFLPENIRYVISNILDQQDIQKDVHAVVLNLARLLEEHIWANRGFGNHTGVSIIDSVKQRNIICIRVSDSLPFLLEYINTELQILSNEKVPMLIVGCGIDFKNCPALQARFLPEFTRENVYTGILLDSTSSLTSDNTEISRLFSRYPQIFVFRCASNPQAEPFSNAFGTYMRTERERTRTHTRQPFRIFRSHGNTTAERIIPERNINIKDLTGLNDGVMLCGSAYEVPIIINHFDTAGGVNHGLLLP